MEKKGSIKESLIINEKLINISCYFIINNDTIVIEKCIDDNKQDVLSDLSEMDIHILKEIISSLNYK